ncbi:MAG TPA: hypothetical protein VN822_02380 [Candidatus Acidoferrales bacterium]|nr:hypothetical protein [Candidatus Acidoferrales bacterium]
MTLPHFSFADFCVLAAILVMLGGFSFLEVLIFTAVKREQEESKLIDLRRAATFSVVGAIVTLFVGALSQILHRVFVDVAAISIPFLFLITWAILQKRGTSVLKFEYLERQAEEYYSGVIEAIVKEHAGAKDPLQLDQLYDDCSERIRKEPLWWSINVVVKHGPVIAPGPGLEQLFGEMALSKEKFRILVDRLVRKDRLEILVDGSVAVAPERSLWQKLGF